MTITDGTHAASVDYTPIFISQLLDTIGGHFDRHSTAHADMATHLAIVEQKIAAAAVELTDIKAQIAEIRAGTAALLANLAAVSVAAPTVTATPELPAVQNQAGAAAQ